MASSGGSKTVCRDYNSPKGCKRQNCRFRHPDKPKISSSSPSSSTANQANPPPSSGSKAKDATNVPDGVCRTFWSSGTCKYDKCKFRHIKSRAGPSSGPGSGRQAPGGKHKAAPNTATPTSGNGLSASETLQQLTAFCSPKIDFKRPVQLESFGVLLANGGSKDTTWDGADSHRFLELVTEPHGLSRIETILTFSDVVPRVEKRRDAISFSTTYLSCLSYMVSQFVLDSTLHQRVNSLFGLLHNQYPRVNEVVSSCMKDIVSRRSFEDPPHGVASGPFVFRTLGSVLTEYMVRFKSSVREHESLVPLVESLSGWFNTWKAGGFKDGWVPQEQYEKNLELEKLDRQMKRMMSIASRELASIKRKEVVSEDGLLVSAEARQRQSLALLGPLQLQYDPAGSLREGGARHDNDFEDIRVISIAPTQEEMVCSIAPFLPANISGAPHHLPGDSMERLLDIQFRLLREELIAPLRTALQMILEDLQKPSPKTTLAPILAKRGGRYNAVANWADSALVNVYTGVDPSKLVTNNRGVSIEVKMDTPPGAARAKGRGKRIEFWNAVSRKRLMQGGLVAIIWQEGSRAQLFFGLISSPLEVLQESVKNTEQTIIIHVNFFDPSFNLRVMEWRQLSARDRKGTQILMVEAPVMYESIRPFLQALQREPTSIPFGQYLVHRPSSQNMTINPPRYTTVSPNFRWNLSCLFRAGHAPVSLNPSDAASVEAVKRMLREESRLDGSQADAMMDCLTQEFCLIQGPPGTGKSYTGVEIMRTLIENRVGRILLIAFTNHALDHLLSSVLKVNITKKIVRLGSRSNDEEVSKYSLYNLEKLDSGNAFKRRTIGKAFAGMRGSEKELAKILAEIQGSEVPDSDREVYMKMFFPDHFDELLHPPAWVEALCQEQEEGWTKAGQRKGEKFSRYAFWVTGQDIRWVEGMTSAQQQRAEALLSNRFNALEVEQPEDEDSGTDGSSSDTDSEHLSVNDAHTAEGPVVDAEEEQLQTFLQSVGLDALPLIEHSDRSLKELSAHPFIWQMALGERKRLAQSWTEGTRQHFFDSKKEAYSYQKAKYEAAKEAFDECKAQVRLDMLKAVDIIGCTTTGAASLTKLLTGIRPTIILVEEAGQVLESHILGSLVQSVEHVIMIGDPLQLRPTINNYSLSMDHPRGKHIYKFDQSTMERLDAAGMPMSKLTVQRRMRPQISSIPRTTLYPKLEDSPAVAEYPNVRGIAKNMFFLHHTHAEGGADEESMSKYNAFEVNMIAELVHHLLRQGIYTRSGSIAVLCMYLGQLAKLREVLQKRKISVVMDSRDEDELQDREGDKDVQEDGTPAEVAELKVTDQVLLRTVDNFQGEEADIILLSLVRNHGASTQNTIGFLKSENRTNVALTRARHGMYVFGHGDLLAQKSPMWKKVVNEFKEQDCYGSALPINCYRHPRDVKWVDDPSHLRQVSPDGGCLLPCDVRLKCGHTCPSKCHADDPGHVLAKCYEPCRRACPQGHPCNRLCWEDCGHCQFPLPELPLECGHVLLNAPCFLTEDHSQFQCQVDMEKKLPFCEHSAILPCFQDPQTFQCSQPCGRTMSCCQKACTARCGECQKLSTEPTRRDSHRSHVCGRIMHCQHDCNQPCVNGHNEVCGTKDCNGACKQSCVHHRCKLGCSTPCIPCTMPCTWKCEHQACPVPCGSPCVRLPCNFPCTRSLKGCGHPCPSLCGEPCWKQQCHICATDEEKEKVVDLIMNSTLAEIDSSSNDLDSITITLGCRHTFTVETLDGLCGLQTAYEWNESIKLWTRPLLPEDATEKAPSCPTCRAPVDALRYGRIVKRCNLDLLERNAATRMAKELAVVHQRMSVINRAELERQLEGLVSTNTGFALIPEKMKKKEDERIRLLQASPQIPYLPPNILGAKLSKICSLPKSEREGWTNCISPLLQVYDSAFQISAKRSAHGLAYDASCSTLYERELELAREGPNPPKHPESYALRIAKMKVGMTPPRADVRFQIEAILTTIDIRFVLGSMAEKWHEILRSKIPVNPAQLEAWAELISFIYASCRRDATVAFQLASSTSAYKQELLTSLRGFKAAWRSVQFNAVKEQSRQDGLSGEEKKQLGLAVKKRLDAVREEASKLRLQCVRNGNLALNIVEEEFDGPLSRCFSNWENLVEALNRPSTFYQTVSDEEMRQVVSSFASEYTHRGHWYRCPNGHIFTIANCGGANQVSRCNECGATIGGQNHQTVAGVSQATELESISATHGAAASPFTWGRGV